MSDIDDMQWEVLQHDLDRIAQEKSVRDTLRKEAKEKEKAYEEGPQNFWQVGCPYNLKDVVLLGKDEGKVIGLPTQADAAAGNDRAGKAWIYFPEGKRGWYKWNDLKLCKRSPPRAK